MDLMSRATPRLQLLTAGQIALVHAKALQILEQVGLRLASPRARQALAAREGAMLEGERVRLEPALVEWALQAAPQQVALYDRRRQPAFTLGADRTRFGMGVTTLYYLAPGSREPVPFTRQHMRDCARLGDGLPHFDALATLGVVQDVDPHLADLYGTLDLLASSQKTLILLVSDPQAFPRVLDMIEALCGPLGEQPFVLPYFNPITPLVINAGTADKMFAAIERGLPIIYSNYGMLGATTPITLAGALALLTAELLAGLTLAQCIRPATPVVLGSLPALFDMRTMVSYYGPWTMLLNLACAEMMAHYRVPHCSTSGSTGGWGADPQAAAEQMLNQITAALGRAGMAPFVGSVLGGKVFAPANAVLADEIIGWALRFGDGLPLGDDLFALQDIAEVGPGGTFLGTERTVANYRALQERNPLFAHPSFEQWLEWGRPMMQDRLWERTQELLISLPPPADQGELLARGQRWIADATGG